MHHYLTFEIDGKQVMALQSYFENIQHQSKSKKIMNFDLQPF